MLIVSLEIFAQGINQNISNDQDQSTLTDLRWAYKGGHNARYKIVISNHLKEAHKASITTVPQVVEVAVPAEKQKGGNEHPHMVVDLQIATGSRHVINEDNQLHPSWTNKQEWRDIRL